MEFLKKIGDFLRNHYEKVLLSVILVVLAAAAAYLPIKIKQNQARIEEILRVSPPKPTQPLKPADLSTNEAVLAKASKLPRLDLGTPHHVLNPVTWKQLPDGRIIKIDSEQKEGAGALIVTRITPLHLNVGFLGIRGESNDLRYGFLVRREMSKTGGAREVTHYISPGGKADVSNPPNKPDTLTLRTIQGPPQDPTSLTLELSNPPSQLILTKEKPAISMIVGYTADIRYPNANRDFLDRKLGQQLDIGNEKFKIVVINENEVRVEGPNGNRTTIRFAPPPSTPSEKPKIDK